MGFVYPTGFRRQSVVVVVVVLGWKLQRKVLTPFVINAREALS